MARDTRALMEPLFRYANRTPFNIAPERGQALAEEIFKTARWQLTAEGGNANFYAFPQEARVTATYAGLASLWCLAFVAVHLTDIASRQRRASDKSAQHFDIGTSSALLRLGEYLAYARSLFRGDREWPEPLQIPDDGAPLSSEAGKVNNVFFGALSWVLLHEIGHVHLEHELLIPADQLVRQEFAADGFATEWVLADAGEGLQREFRVLMVCVALAWIFLNEETIGRGADHPAAIVRLQEAVAHFDVGARSAALENAVYLFKSIFDPETDPPGFESPEEAFEWMQSRLEVIFPR
jgi:hypothetical protein